MEPEPLPGLDPLLLEHFVLPLLARLRLGSDAARCGRGRLPLIGLNGPVGAGKTSLGRQLEALASRFGLRLCVASIDDLYLGWPERGERLAGNPFGVSRVPPGSHDLPLLQEALIRWRQSGILRLPRFDKTLAGGQGDRAGWRERPCDALVLEGWLMGCRPLSDARLMTLLAAAASGSAEMQTRPGGPDDPLFSGCGAPALRPEEWRWLPRWNRELAQYLPIWQACDGLWLLRPLHWGLPRRWRFQAEARQRRAGGGWLSPEALDRLVRASLCSLPPALYQDPLMQKLSLPALTVGETSGWEGRCGNDGTSPSAANGHEPAGIGPRALPQLGLTEEWAAGGAGDRQDRCGSAAPADFRSTVATAGTSQAPGCASDRSQDISHGPQATPSQQESRLNEDDPQVQAVAWLDGRRRCRAVRLQASLSPSSSATG